MEDHSAMKKKYYAIEYLYMPCPIQFLVEFNPVDGRKSVMLLPMVTGLRLQKRMEKRVQPFLITAGTAF